MSAEVRHPSNFEQPPAHFMRIGFENYPEYLRTRQNQTQDPMDPTFNLWYWCGIKTEEERQEFVQQYVDYTNMIPESFYNGDSTAVDTLIANGTLTPATGEVVKMNINIIFRDAIDRPPYIPTNSTLPGTDINQIDEKRKVFRILFAIYSKPSPVNL